MIESERTLYRTIVDGTRVAVATYTDAPGWRICLVIGDTESDPVLLALTDDEAIILIGALRRAMGITADS